MFWKEGARGICHENRTVHTQGGGNPHLDLKGVRRTADWLDHQDVCLKLKISKRTLQTLRDNDALAYTEIGDRTYYPPENVKRIVTKVEDGHKDARYRGHTI